MTRFTYSDVDLLPVVHDTTSGEYHVGEWSFDDKVDSSAEEARSAALAYVSLYEYLTRDAADVPNITPGKPKVTGGQVLAIIFLILIGLALAVWVVGGFVHGVGIILRAWQFDGGTSVSLLLPFFGIGAFLVIRLINAAVKRLSGNK